jgi:pilus assembly protein Flp/PilA
LGKTDHACGHLQRKNGSHQDAGRNGVVENIGELKMTKLFNLIQTLKNDETAQDMVEYALLAGFIAVAAGAVLPGISASLSTIFSKMASLTSVASTK